MAPRECSSSGDVDLLDLRLAARAGGRVEGAGAEERDARRRLPADVDEHGVLEGGALADERAVARLEVDEVPVEARVEPCGEAGSDVGGEDGVREEHRVVAAVLHDLRDDVDARLRQRRLERVAVGDVHGCGAVAAGFRREGLDAAADEHGVGAAE